MNKGKYLNDVLTNMEAEEIISRKLIDYDYYSIGSGEFIKHHAYLNKLNMQSVKNALIGGEDFIMEYFVANEKIKPLIKELFIINSFKSLIFPKIKKELSIGSSIKAYLCIYHEAVIVNLLENFFYSVTACLAADDHIVDIIEYCYKKITRCMSKHNEYKNKTLPSGDKNKFEFTKMSQDNELDSNFEEIEFNLAMCSISILRYISDHLNQLPFPVRHHMMNVKDIPLLLVALMEIHPWVREYQTDKNETVTEIFENNQWHKLQPGNKIPKLEAQVWITVFNLFMNQDNTKKYEITEFRKTNLLRLRKFMNETLFDQIPPLQQFFRALEEMSLMEYSAVQTSNPFIVEMIPVLYNKKYFTQISEEEFTKISAKIIGYFKLNPTEMKKEMEVLSEIFNTNNLEYFMDDPKCANCGKDASSRCSKCKSEWYCGKECQIKRWKLHKTFCTRFSEMMLKTSNENEKENESDNNINTPQKISSHLNVKNNLITEINIDKDIKEVNQPKTEQEQPKITREFDELD
jgi:predicted Zn-ribbon and HTH transcriptional regulator